VTADGRQLSLRGVLAEIWGAYRAHWRFLIPAAAIVLLPQSVVDGLLEEFHVDHIRTLADVATIGAALLMAAVNLMGQVVYSGLTAAAVVEWRAGQPLPPLSALIRSLPIGRLIVLDLVVTLAVAIGFVLLIVPGLIVLAYLAPSAPVMKLEHLGVRDAIRRSIELVRGRARSVFVIVVGVVLVTELAVELIAVPFDAAWTLIAINLLGEAVFQPFEGLVIALVAIHLLELHGQAPAPDEMARALVGEHDQAP
jgi:Uncharacterised protein family (UPF0259)